MQIYIFLFTSPSQLDNFKARQSVNSKLDHLFFIRQKKCQVLNIGSLKDSVG